MSVGSINQIGSINLGSINQAGQSPNQSTNQSANDYNNAVNSFPNAQNNNVGGNSNTNNQGSDSNSNSNKKPISADAAKKAADKINKLLEDSNTRIEYDQDKEFKNVMVMKVVDTGTNKVLRQIPSEQVLQMVSDFSKIAGLLVDGKA
jgi:flagellar protein FlaG